ncbi:hypothetical protein BKA65DRAFT_594220 [Rhexocercosporidium sp. MPI-PUGE-AT-0058]|nr:hypothetical protein BKA65DRAFT_594220 [Rhexocercosporidium sp. MPI-PUGE-AT-0058]
MLSNKILLLALGSLLGVSAQEQGNGNITVSFFPGSESTCPKNSTAALILTTSSRPSGYTCFNLTDIFTSNSTTGTQGLWHNRNINSSTFRGVDYFLENRDAFDPAANYSRVWYEQVNETGTIKPGTDGAWVFYTYAFLDCQQVGGDKFEMKEYPWFETSCQTKPGGECRDVMKSVKSFAIGPAALYNAGHRGCETWAELGGASMLERRSWVIGIVGVAMGAFLL